MQDKHSPNPRTNSWQPSAPDQPLHDVLIPITSNAVIQDLSQHADISCMWNLRDGIRPFVDNTSGVRGAARKMSLTACYLSDPTNPLSSIYLPDNVDTTVVDHMRKQGLLGNVEYVRNLSDLKKLALSRKRKVYSVDDYGSEYNGLTLNSSSDMKEMNSKQCIELLFPKAALPYRKLKRVDDISLSDYQDTASKATGRGRVFLKLCNTEHNGDGVFAIDSESQFLQTLEEVQQHLIRYQLNPMVVLEAEVAGVSRSINLFISPKSDSTASFLATSRLINADDAGVRFAGNILDAPTQELLEPLREPLRYLLDSLRSNYPNASGFFLADYVQTPDGNVCFHDIALRSGGNIPASLIRMKLVEQTGGTPYVVNFVPLQYPDNGVHYSDVSRHLGAFDQLDHILDTGYGVLPWGWNHISSEGRFIFITPSESDYDTFYADILNRLTWRPHTMGVEPTLTQREFRVKDSIAPTPLRRGDKIALVASSNAVPQNRKDLFHNTSTYFCETLDLELIFGKTMDAIDKHGIAAGTPQERCNELHEFFRDPQISMIWLAHGGACSSQLLPYLDYEMIARHPKIIAGLSDNVVLLNALYAKTGLITFVGPEAKFGREGEGMTTEYSQNAFHERFFMGGESTIAALQERHCIRAGSASGHLIGGNLTSFVSLIGSDYLPEVEGAILLLEGLSVTPETAVLMTQQIKNSGIFSKLAGILVGNIYSFDREPGYSSQEGPLSYEEILLEACSDYDFPILKFHEIGHRCPANYFPIGGQVSFDASHQTIQLHSGYTNSSTSANSAQ